MTAREGYGLDDIGPFQELVGRRRTVRRNQVIFQGVVLIPLHTQVLQVADLQGLVVQGNRQHAVLGDGLVEGAVLILAILQRQVHAFLQQPAEQGRHGLSGIELGRLLQRGLVQTP